MNYGFVIDNRKCIGCHACTVACKSEHDIPIGVNRTHVKYVEKGKFPHTRRTFTVTRCNHCADAPCTEICPTSALFTRGDGIVDFDSQRCIACKSCMQACPYDALYIDPATRTAAKCNYCAHRIEGGYEPACVIVCPVEAIISGDLDDAASPISQLVAREEVTVRKPEKGTAPKLYYIDGDHSALDPTENDPLAAYFTTDQATGVGHFAEYVEDRLSRAAREDIFQPFEEASAGSPGGVQLAGAISISQRAVDDVRREIESDGRGSRRVYDSPHKGVLWGWKVAAYIWTKAISAGILLVSLLAGLMIEQPSTAQESGGLATALVFLALTMALLVLDLDQPKRFLYVLLRPNWRSWLVRGGYILAGYGLCLSLLLLGLLAGASSWMTPLRWAAFVLALLGAVYTAFLFAQAKGRDFWQSPLSPLRMLNQALMAGTAVWILIRPEAVTQLGRLLIWLIIANLTLLLLEAFTPHSSADAQAAARIMTRGKYRSVFLAGILVGSLLPLAILALGGGGILGLSGAVLVLAGIYLTEHAWVHAPQMVPLA